MEAVLRHHKIPHRRSTDAGQYVCESTYWTLLDFAATHRPGMYAGFLHVPAISDVWPVQRVVEVVWDLLKGIHPSRDDSLSRVERAGLRE